MEVIIINIQTLKHDRDKSAFNLNEKKSRKLEVKMQNKTGLWWCMPLI